MKSCTRATEGIRADLVGQLIGFAQAVSQVVCRSHLYVCRRAHHLMSSSVRVTTKEEGWKLTCDFGLSAETSVAHVKLSCRIVIGGRKIIDLGLVACL